jgi:GGDEF domain-containing protein
MNLNNTIEHQTVLKILEALKPNIQPKEINIKDSIKNTPRQERIYINKKYEEITSNLAKNKELANRLEDVCKKIAVLEIDNNIKAKLIAELEDAKRVQLDTMQTSQNIEEDMLLTLIQGSKETKIDPNTGLQIRRAFFDEGGIIFKEWLKQPEKTQLKNHVIYSLDMDNFKYGNSIVGHYGFDQLIRQLSKGFMGISQFLAGDNPNTAYGNDYSANQTVLDLYFPPESEAKQILELAKQNGIVIELYREKAGADEFFFMIHYNKGFSADRQDLAESIIHYMFYNTTIPKAKPNEQPQETKERLAVMAQNALNYPDLLKIETTAENASEIIRINSFFDALKQRLNLTNLKQQIIENPSCLIHFGATMNKGDFADVFTYFFLDEKTGLLKGNKEEQDVQIEKLASNLRVKLNNIIDEYGITEGEKIEEIAKQMLSDTIMGPFIQLQSQKIDELKIIEKQNLIIKALQGKNPEALYQLAALLQEGRLINLDNKIKREIFIKLEKYYYDLHQHSTLLGELREYFTKYPNLLS